MTYPANPSKSPKLGDRIEVSAAGVEKSSKYCICTVASMTSHAAMARDGIAEGLNPDDMWFSSFSCQDADFCNDSWGQVRAKVSVE